MADKDFQVQTAHNDPYIPGRPIKRIKWLRLRIKNGRSVSKAEYIKNARCQLPTKCKESP